MAGFHRQYYRLTGDSSGCIYIHMHMYIHIYLSTTVHLVIYLKWNKQWSGCYALYRMIFYEVSFLKKTDIHKTSKNKLYPTLGPQFKYKCMQLTHYKMIYKLSKQTHKIGKYATNDIWQYEYHENKISSTRKIYRLSFTLHSTMKRTQCALYDMIFLIELAFRKKLIRTNCPDTQNHRKVNCIQQYTLQTQIHTTNSLQKNDLHIVKTYL